MKAVACSEASMLPVPVRSFRDPGKAIEQTIRFTPGILVKVLLESGDEEGALLRWSE
jgi:hypothetical protein